MTDIISPGITSVKRSSSNIFLIGFMGSGKSHWGKIWAVRNQMSFIDLDEVVEKKAGKTIADIFETLGQNHFRKLEEEALRNCDQLQNTIVACGGGAPCFFENMRWMNEHGITVYIACSISEILNRVLAEQQKRPLIKKLNQAELLFFIEQTLREREPFYHQAQVTVQSGALTSNSFPGIISTITN